LSILQDVFGMIEIDLDAPAFFPVEKIAKAVIVLRNTDGVLNNPSSQPGWSWDITRCNV
jgi:hypothetical protein